MEDNLGDYQIFIFSLKNFLLLLYSQLKICSKFLSPIIIQIKPKIITELSRGCFAFAGLPGFLFSPIGIFFADNVLANVILDVPST
ncbi:hypothetical protein BpHYR1_032607 [Brachionus plicatilis]|uniref:Uncharacterized protein n=1 Tax=Brachionus plicatilis TaxID=10195 RepID=A0A3M7QYV5_BRAPC|nr:hypothetical protein BpHYR1_032607 [Brachionus plicatilis]